MYSDYWKPRMYHHSIETLKNYISDVNFIKEKRTFHRVVNSRLRYGKLETAAVETCLFTTY